MRFLDIFFKHRPGKIVLRQNNFGDIYTLLNKTYWDMWDVTSLFQYKHKLVRDVIHEMKYYNNPLAYKFFSHALCLHILHNHHSRSTPIYITTIPIHLKRYREKGFDHMDKLCKEISKNPQISYTPLLKKIHHTKRQAHIKDKKDRRNNLKNCFTINSDTKIPEQIILIDDVYTTGTTLCEARSLLDQYGAKVTCMTLAH